MGDELRGPAEEPIDMFKIPVPCCPACDSTNTIEGPGAGPHYARLVCGDCGRFIRWLPRPAGAAKGCEVS
jgi:hypothetical protein